MYDVFVPFDDLSNNYCVTYNDDGSVLYYFDREQISNDVITGKKVFVNNHYNIIDSTFENIKINCINNDNLTNNWFYRNDLPDVLISFFFMISFFFCIPFILFSRIFKRKLL